MTNNFILVIFYWRRIGEFCCSCHLFQFIFDGLVNENWRCTGPSLPVSPRWRLAGPPGPTRTRVKPRRTCRLAVRHGRHCGSVGNPLVNPLGNAEQVQPAAPLAAGPGMAALGRARPSQASLIWPKGRAHALRLRSPCGQQGRPRAVQLGAAGWPSEPGALEALPQLPLRGLG